MLYTNLEEVPNFVQKAVNLIENSFGYTAENSFAVDFYPLMKKSNYKNCHIIIDNDEVIAHIGVLERQLEINNKLHTIYMYGGIAVSDKYRGKGIFKDFFNSLLEQYKDCALHLLWSEKLDLYKKFNFYPCIGLYEYKKESFEHSYIIDKTKLKDIDSEILNKIKELYINNDVRIVRSNQHWEELKRISSSDIFLVYQQKELTNYFIMNKGADLIKIIHEYGFMNYEQLQIMRNYGTVWSSTQLGSNNNSIYASVARVGEIKLFSSFIKDMTNFEIVQVSKEVVEFKNNNDIYKQSLADFIVGVLGPGKYKELEKTANIYITGLDSI
jgi:GNAT superfamily N-acetyltransferase